MTYLSYRITGLDWVTTSFDSVKLLFVYYYQPYYINQVPLTRLSPDGFQLSNGMYGHVGRGKAVDLWEGGGLVGGAHVDQVSHVWNATNQLLRYNTQYAAMTNQLLRYNT